MEGWQIAGGTVTGTDHLNPIKFSNNQDAFYWIETPDMIIAVVSDGCGSKPNSEVGAKIGSRIVARNTLRWMNQWGLNAARKDITELREEFMWELIRIESVAKLQGIARGMGPCLHDAIKDSFLFTIVGVVLTDSVFVLFTIGDGFAVKNGREIPLGEYPNDAPPYMMYSPIMADLIDPPVESCEVAIHDVSTIDVVEHIVIGSDGAKKHLLPALDNDISEFWQEDRYFSNTDQVRRRLAIINKTNFIKVRGPLKDDTTLVIIRRVPEMLGDHG